MEWSVGDPLPKLSRYPTNIAAVTKNKKGGDENLKIFISETTGPIRLFRIMSIPTTFRLFLVLTSEQIGRRLPVFTLLLSQQQMLQIISNCNMETLRKPLNKYWCSVPHYRSDIRNIYIKTDRFPLMMLTVANKERKQI